MKNRSFISEENKGFENQFEGLSNDEMNSLRGGDSNPIPSTGGSDYPIPL